MKGKLISKIQEGVIKLSLNSVGRSMPATVYEKEIPEAVLMLHNKKRNPM